MDEPVLTCEEVLRHLFAYLDREADPHTASEIERHLERCRSCFSRAEFERRLKAELRAAGNRSAPARLRARIRELVGKF
ncbi:MAG TPA: zf-HC2 domain-containing protein [Burkholderiales bacterium]|nr:zf-HC2 domain-containing protein [Burkholderiales bacterium]